MESRRICPNCRAFVSSADRVCPYCEFQIAPKDSTQRESVRRDYTGTIGGLIPTAKFTTAMILFINFALFLASSLTEAGRGLLEAGAMFGPAVFQGGQWWRLITAGFFHGGILHILMNSWVLFDLGAQIEEIYGSSKLIFFYFIATVGGFLLSGLVKTAPSVGSSAGIYGLIGVMIALGIHSRSAMGDQIRALYTRWAIFGLVMSLIPGIDLAAHVGGMAAGFAISYLVGFPSAFYDRRESLWRYLSAACVVVTGFAFVQMFLMFVRSN